MSKATTGLSANLTALLNRHCAENASDTPDFVLAEYLLSCLAAFNQAVNAREKWYGREPGPQDPADLNPEPCREPSGYGSVRTEGGGHR